MSLLDIAIANKHNDIIKLLIEYNVKININVFQNACSNRDLECVKILYKHDKTVNVKNIFECTPFMIAAEKGHKEVVEYLLQCNDAIIDERNEDESSALYVASQNS